MVTTSALKKISRRIRHGQRRPEDIEIIDNFRDSKLQNLYSLQLDINESLSHVETDFLISGRSKRTKSIIRKLERGGVKNIASIVDIVGVRIIVGSLRCQDTVMSVLIKQYNISVASVKDYRSRAEGYRAVHVYANWSESFIEVQIRTLPQQLWANESEALGERVKEGGGTDEQKQYLHDLNIACRILDDDPQEHVEEVCGIGEFRGPVKGRLPRLLNCFQNAVGKYEEIGIYLIIYDSWTNELLSKFKYSMSEKENAIKDFCHKSRSLRQDRFDVLFLNANSLDALKVTHPIYFPIM